MATSNQVEDMQRFANELGVLLTVDGMQGYNTRRFTRMFQSTFALGRWAMSPLMADGDPGTRTMEAVKHCRDTDHKVTDHFAYSEFLTKGSRTPTRTNHVLRLERQLAVSLERLRVHIGQPLHVLSAYRDPAHNRSVGGASRSQHLYGMAVDINRPRTGREVTESEARAAGFRGIGMLSSARPGRDVIHVDVRSSDARWFYT